jgi:predicted phosphoribosyltransferase
MTKAEVFFLDRREAGRELAADLLARGVKAGVVLGLTRGGVPVAYEVALALDAALDIVVVKKVGAPFSAELALGAVCSDGTLVTRTEAIQEMGIPEDYLQREVVKMSQEAHEAEGRYRGGVAALELSGRQVVVVDDGIATGSSIEAAVKSARRRGASRVIVAVPVSSEHAARMLSVQADEFICLGVPPDFWAVGQFYADFSPVYDEEVRDLLAKARTHTPAADGPGARSGA